ncbi:MAG TPA: STAS domain-containing protein [Candidatus Lokiarchaeia archaeon]|nr:STAS domain-containing protein [Candidatus Lokiarchaeia archaeon]
MENSSIPILRLGNYLISSPQIAIHDKIAVQYKDEVLQKIVALKAKGLILDISAIDVVDSFLVRVISEIASSANLMGCPTVVTGMSPAVAITLTEMDLSLSGVFTALDIEKSLKILREKEGRHA